MCVRLCILFTCTNSSQSIPLRRRCPEHLHFTAEHAEAHTSVCQHNARQNSFRGQREVTFSSCLKSVGALEWSFSPESSVRVHGALTEEAQLVC
jgi:hypothetical protein